MGATTAQRNLATVSRFMELVPAGELDEAARLTHDGFVVHEPPGLPYGGEYDGLPAFFELLTKISAALELTPLAVKHVADGDTVLARISLRFTARATGASLDMELANIFTLRDGRIAELDVFYKDPSGIGELLAQ